MLTFLELFRLIMSEARSLKSKGRSLFVLYSEKHNYIDIVH